MNSYYYVCRYAEEFSTAVTYKYIDLKKDYKNLFEATHDPGAFSFKFISHTQAPQLFDGILNKQQQKALLLPVCKSSGIVI